MIVPAVGQLPDGRVMWRFTCSRCTERGEWRAAIRDAEIDGAKHDREKHTQAGTA